VTSTPSSGDATSLAPSGFEHVLAQYADDDALLAVVLPFLAEGAARGEPALVVVDESTSAVLRAALADPEVATFVPAEASLARPAMRRQTLERAIELQLASGAPRVRIVSALPIRPRAPDGGSIDDDHRWQPWVRFEAHLEAAFAGRPVSHLCLYDRRLVGDAVPAAIIAAHRWLATEHGIEPNPAAVDQPLSPELFSVADPGEPGAPSLELEDPSPGEARRGVAALAEQSGLDDDDREGIVSSVSEIVTNALVHGRPPVALCAWAKPGRVTVTVTDHGGGPSDPTVGMAPAVRAPGEGGFGLWIAHQLCREVTLHRIGDAFAVRMVVGSGPADA
jgi:anti-sigma regulatory factor (Ser/Thr protein kinase)